MQYKIIIDTDIGDDIDDAYALAYALNRKEFDILGITTVYRNSYQRAKIVAALLDSYNRKDIPVCAGEDYPIKNGIHVESFVTLLPDGRPNIPHYFEDFADYDISNTHAVDFILNQIKNNPYQITLVAIGPYTNLARAYQKDPETFKKLKMIMCMGGQSLSTFAEWNVRCDPEACDIILKSGVPLTFVGVDVTKECYLSQADIHYLTTKRSKSGQLLARMLNKWLNDNKKIPIMHDGLTLAQLIEDFCDLEERFCEICLEGINRAVMLFGNSDEGSKIVIATSVCSERFIPYFLSNIY